MSKLFSPEQFIPTKYDTAEEKAKWANAMSSWIQEGFPKSGWTSNLYYHLYQHMYNHIAHSNAHGFWCEWFSTLPQQVDWLDYARRGGASGIRSGDPSASWCDVEEAFTTWLRTSGIVEQYRTTLAQAIEAYERAQLAALQAKYPKGEIGMEKIDIRFGELPDKALFFLEGVLYTKTSYQEIRRDVYPPYRGTGEVNAAPADFNDPFVFVFDEQIVQVDSANGIRLESLNEIMARPAPPPDPKLEEELRGLRKTLDIARTHYPIGTPQYQRPVQYDGHQDGEEA
jgi:hypothetical protein